MELIIGPRTYSTWSLRGWLVMKRTGADFTTVDVRYETQAQKAALRQVSPSGFVPVLRHGDTLIWDTLAIAEWAAETYPEASVATNLLLGSFVLAMYRALAALAETLADKPVALLRAHGMVTVGPTLPVAIFRAIFTVISANIQHQTIALGGRIAALDAEEGALADVVNVQTVGRSWDLWKKRVS